MTSLSIEDIDLIDIAPHQFVEQTQRKAADAQKRMGKDGKRPTALIMFAQIALNLDQFLGCEAVALVGPVFDDVFPIVAPAANDGPGVIFLGSFQ